MPGNSQGVAFAIILVFPTLSTLAVGLPSGRVQAGGKNDRLWLGGTRSGDLYASRDTLKRHKGPSDGQEEIMPFDGRSDVSEFTVGSSGVQHH